MKCLFIPLTIAKRSLLTMIHPWWNNQKFMARKARKCQSQNGRLALPALELAYLFLAITHAPKHDIVNKMIPLVEAQLEELKKYAKDTKRYGLLSSGDGEVVGKAGVGYWDDWCLTRFLEGVCLRYVAYPVRLSPSISTFQQSGGAGTDSCCMLYVGS